MNPFIFTIVGPVALSWYGLCAAAGVSLFIYLAYTDIRRSSIATTPQFFDCASAGMLGGIFGGKLLFLAASADTLAALDGWHDIARLTVNGFAILGAIVGAAVGLFSMARWLRVDVVALLDLAGAYALIAHSISRVGCFIAGCCYGTELASPALAVVYTHPACLAPLGVGLFPAQIVMSLFSLVGFFFCSWLYHRRGRRDGVTFATYLMWESGGRFLIDFWRGDSVPVWCGLSAYQSIALCIVLGGALRLWFLSWVTRARRRW